MKRRGFAAKEARDFYLFVLPGIAGFIIWTAGPIVFSIILAFCKWEIVIPPKFIGFGNFKRLFLDDPLFWKSLKVTFIYTGGAVPLGLMTALLLALLLNQKIKGRVFFRLIFYIPAVISGVVASLLWQFIFTADVGLLNWGLSKLGIEGPPWLSSTTWVLPAFIIMSLWQVGTMMVIYLAGLQGIPRQLYEVAELDGANRWQKFWSITIPSLTPVIFFTLIIGMIGCFKMFTTSYVMTKGGPGSASLFYVLYLYQNAFEYFKMGYASALAWILFFIIMGLTLLLFKSGHKWVHYE